MAPSIDYVASILLCAEDCTAILDLEEEGSEEISWVLGPSSRHADASLGAMWTDFPLQSDDCIEALLGREEEHLPMEGYAQRLLQQPGGSDLVAMRCDAIDWIWKVHEHYKFGPLTAVLSVNYLDRFLSVYDLPQGKAWMTQLLAVACLSLAAKMEETIVPHPLDLQVGEAKYVFEVRTIQRMELLVLNTLSWRMQAVTACSFIDYYLHKFSEDHVVSKIIHARSVDLILSTSKVAEFLVFRPSEIAASVALVAFGKHENSVLGSVATCCKHLIKERVLGCYEVIQKNIVVGNIILQSVGSSVFIVPHSPIGVLDAVACESQQTEGTSAGAPTIYFESSPASKRRKICI
ncbi:cyclin-D3-1-like [Phragmites australis]|uniref:cyclin-D3-1-like n=1 Tax=Phragmites australis TaxID=29695 RepID=UPI002D76BDA9|nr:cyclin-D3-1-like [Phragmites australis]